MLRDDISIVSLLRIVVSWAHVTCGQSSPRADYVQRAHTGKICCSYCRPMIQRYVSVRTSGVKTLAAFSNGCAYRNVLEQWLGIISFEADGDPLPPVAMSKPTCR